MTASKAIKSLKAKASPEKAVQQKKFFKTGKGEYGEGDIFIGVTVPEIRLVAKQFNDLGMGEIKELLNSKINECRLLALIISVHQFKKGGEREKKQLYDFYLENKGRINNWNLVDSSVEHVIGGYLEDKDKSVLYGFARSSDLWERRIAMISTFHFIRKSKFDDTLKIAEILLHDKHDLIHKAVGWMLREVGKRDAKILEGFLDKYAREMPRTTLRYAIEKFPQDRRKYYMCIN